MSGANFSGATLTKAEFQPAPPAEDESGPSPSTRLAHAVLAGANLTGANLTGADLSGADLRGADLTGAIGLTRQQVATTITDSRTRWPAEFRALAQQLESTTR